MLKTSVRVVICVVILFGVGCGRIGFEALRIDSDSNSGGDSNSVTTVRSSDDTNDGSGSVGDTVSDPGGDTGLDTESEMGLDTVWDSGSGADTGSDADTDTDTDTDTDADTDTDTDADTDTDTDADTDTDTAADTDTDTDTDADTDSVTDTVNDTGTYTGTGTGIDAGTDAIADTGTETETNVDTSTYGADHSQTVSASLSLEDAINSANSDAAPDIIFIEAGWDVTLGSSLPSVTESLTIVGNDSLIDGSGLTPSSECMTIEADNVVISRLVFSGCPRYPIVVTGGDNIQIYNNVFSANGDALACWNDATNVVFGPNNTLEDAGDVAIKAQCDNIQIVHNEIYNPGAHGIEVSHNDGALIGNLIVGGSSRNVFISNNSTGWTVWHNTMVNGAPYGLSLSSGASAEIWNNIFAGAGEWGIFVNSGTVISNDHNLFFNNGIGDCSECAMGGNSMVSDPHFVDTITDDYRLNGIEPDVSLAIDAGADLGWDVNGDASGNFNGVAPDIGYHETQ